MNGSGIWPEWQIVEKLGSGSYGAVYKAVRKEHDVESFAAIKVISIPSSEAEIDSLRSEGMSMDEVRKFLEGIVRDCENEIRLMEIFKGVQNIVSMDDYKIVTREDRIGWDIYIRMELLTPFKDINRTLSEDEVIKLGIDICYALELCAERNVIHRDIKLENIFVNDFGFYKLGDFGIARILDNVAGGLSLSGSRNYMAPEVVKGNYDATVDLYSLGIVMYQLLNKNRLPFLDTEQQSLDHNMRIAALNRRFNCEALPPPCDASPEVAKIILCATNPDPRMRFANASAMKAALKNVKNAKLALTEDESNKTVSVRRAAGVPAQSVPQPKDISSKPADTYAAKKKSKVPAIICAVVAACLLIGGAVFAATRFLGGNGTVSPSGKGTTETSETTAETTGTTDTSETEATESKPTVPLDLPAVNFLDQCSPYEKSKYATLYKGDKFFAMNETKYSSGIVLPVDKNGGWFLANLRGEYNELTFQAGHVDGSSATDAVIQIYLDDKPYQPVSITASGAPQTVTIPVTGVRQLKAFVSYDETNYHGEPKIGFADMTIVPNAAAVNKPAEPKDPTLADFLDQCTPYEKSKYTEFYKGDKVFSMSGIKYSSGMVMPVDNNGAWFLSNLRGEYSEWTFEVGHADESYMTDCVLQIYLDDQPYQPVKISSTALSQTITVPVKGVKQIKASVAYDKDTYHGDPKVGFANMVIKPDPDAAGKEPAKDTDALNFLDQCAPYEKSRYTELYSGDKFFSMSGIKYSSGMVMPVSSNGAFFLSNLKGGYTELSFEAGHADGSYMTDIQLQVFLDDELYQQYKLASTALSQTITVPVTGTKQLKIFVTYDKDNYHGEPKIGFANMKLKSDPNASGGQQPADDPSAKRFIEVCPPAEKSKYSQLYNDDRFFSMSGIKYSNGITMPVAETGSFFVSDISAGYNEMTFTAGHVDGTSMTDVKLEIYLDGQLVQGIKISSSGMAQKITVPVVGAKQIKVLVTYEKDSYHGQPTVGLGNILIK
ncbi:MAG: NPCBM/NEW2 domain-containing protein [Clostridiales bacterium]|nr:NPCBM/NEW2 domain-containing protein [Clostridiales bacterium]